MEIFSNYFRFNLHGLLNIVAGTLDLIVGLIVLSRAPKSRLNQSFFLFTLTSSAWVLCFGMISLVKHLEDSYLWLRLAYLIGVPFISPAIYLFSAIWTKTPRFKNKATTGFIWGFFMMLAVTFFCDSFFFIKDFSWGRYTQVNGSLRTWVVMGLQLSQLFLFAMMAFGNFYRAWRVSTVKQERILYRSVFFAFLIAYTGSLDFWVTMRFEFYPFGYISLSLFLYFLSYVIIRHRLLDINLVFKKASLLVLVYGLLFSVTVPFLLSFYQGQFLPMTQRQVVSLLWISVCLGLWLSLGPLIYAYLLRHHFWLRSKMSTGITHELKSPLGSILSSVEILKSRLSEKQIDKDSVLEYADMIERNAARMNIFVRDLLNLAKIQDGARVELNRESCSVKSMLVEIVDIYRASLTQKNINVEISPYEGLIEIDREKIMQVLSNLVSNAVKFSPEKAVIRINVLKEDDKLIFEVRDEGPGVPEPFHEKIFERFFQVNPNAKGSGIGLAIAKAWVEAHGGKIWAKSEGEGKGTKVTFTVPI